MARTIALAQTKGGVGKTSATANIGYSLAKQGHNVLLIDLDKQLSLTRVMFGSLRAGEAGDVGAVMVGERSLSDVILREIRPNLDLAPGSKGSTAQALESIKEGGPESVLKLRMALDAVQSTYDFILIDTPGEQGTAMEVALLGADHVLIPVPPERLCIDGAITTLDHIDHVRRFLPELNVLGLMFMRTGGNATIRTTMEALTRVHAEKRGVAVLKNKIPSEAKYLEAEAVGMPIDEYDPSARSAIAYRAVATEIQEMLAQYEKEEA